MKLIILVRQNRNEKWCSILTYRRCEARTREESLCCYHVPRSDLTDGIRAHFCLQILAIHTVESFDPFNFQILRSNWIITLNDFPLNLRLIFVSLGKYCEQVLTKALVASIIIDYWFHRYKFALCFFTTTSLFSWNK